MQNSSLAYLNMRCLFQIIEEVEHKLDQIKIDKDTDVLESDFDENGEPVFPNNELAKLDEMVNRPKWVIPVLPNGELEVLIDASIKLAKKGWFPTIIDVLYG